MGMGFQSISRYNTPPPFQSLISEGAVTFPVFGFKLGTSGSELYLGGTNSDLYAGDFTWVPLTNEVCCDLKAWHPHDECLYLHCRPGLLASIFQ